MSLVVQTCMISQHNKVSMKPGSCVNSHRTAGPPGVRTSPLRAHATHSWTSGCLQRWQSSSYPWERKGLEKVEGGRHHHLLSLYLTLSQRLSDLFATLSYSLSKKTNKNNNNNNKTWATSLSIIHVLPVIQGSSSVLLSFSKFEYLREDSVNVK